MNLQYRNYTRKFESDNGKQQKKYNIIFNLNYEKTTYPIVSCSIGALLMQQELECRGMSFCEQITRCHQDTGFNFDINGQACRDAGE